MLQHAHLPSVAGPTARPQRSLFPPFRAPANRQAPASPPSPPSSPSSFAAAASSSSSPADATPRDPEQQQKRRDALLRTVRDFYSTLYDYDGLPVDGLVDPGVVLEDDALQVALKGAESVGAYLRWLHTGSDAGEPSAAASIDGGASPQGAAPLEKAVLVGTEAVLADEIDAAAAKAGFALHAGAGAGAGARREDAVVATWVGRLAGGAAGGSGDEQEEVLGREEFFFDASDGGGGGGAGGGGGDPRITHIYTARTRA